MRIRSSMKEWALVALIAAIGVLANLPKSITQTWRVDSDFLLLALSSVLAISLLLYLRFTFFLMFMLLAVGANLPSQIAGRIGITQTPLIIAMTVMVVVSLVNYALKLMPTGLEGPKTTGTSGAWVLFYAIDRDNLAHAQRVLQMGVDPNSATEEGETPLMHAAAAGNAPMIGLLLRHGADLQRTNVKMESALEIALRNNHHAAADTLRRAREELLAQQQQTKAES